MVEIKTKPTDRAVEEFIQSIENEDVRRDCATLIAIMGKATGAPPLVWGPSIIGFGSYHYVYESGREGDWFIAGFSPRKQNITIYLSYGFEEQADKLKDLGKFKTGKACLYVKKLSDINLDILTKLIERTVGSRNS
jgi:hypothetical protein